jgi:flavin-dependent dehydrogenase
MKNILIVGGGTAGWMAAAYLSQNFNVTIIESADIPIIGVGESTLPIIKKFCDDLGLDEKEWMPLCQAEYKLGVRHDGWHKDRKDSWWHWFSYDRTKDADAIRHMEEGTMPSVGNYAYHVDASKFGNIVMKPVALKNNATHIIDTVDDVILAPDGSIDYLVLRNTGIKSYDLYVDATGFSKILAKKVGINYLPYDHLINDSAVACPQELAPIQNRYTITRTMNHGWMWEIALKSRRGAGYVFSSKHCTDEEAIQEYLTYFPESNKEKLRVIKFKPEYAKDPFYKNVATVGMSCGFIEPLEASSIWMITYNVLGLHRCLTEGRSFETFNRAFRKTSLELYNFILSHYTLSGHNHTPYWEYYNNLEKSINTKQGLIEKSKLEDVEFGKHPGIYYPYSWWSKNNYFNKILDSHSSLADM